MPITPNPIPDIRAPRKIKTNKMASCRKIISLYVLLISDIYFTDSVCLITTLHAETSEILILPPLAAETSA
jgi:hypothetical protein